MQKGVEFNAKLINGGDGGNGGNGGLPGSEGNLIFDYVEGKFG